ncbi:MAG: hypothetical protein ACREBI_10845 [Nitrosotalea sp.]
MALARYDTQANAIYVQFAKDKKRIVKTIALGKGTYLDVTENEAFGLEVILPKKKSKYIEEILHHSIKEIELVDTAKQ